MEEEKEASGYVRTIWECPNCGFYNTTEGDVLEQKANCYRCEQSIMIREVL